MQNSDIASKNKYSKDFIVKNNADNSELKSKECSSDINAIIGVGGAIHIEHGDPKAIIEIIAEQNKRDISVAQEKTKIAMEIRNVAICVCVVGVTFGIAAIRKCTLLTVYQYKQSS